MVFNRPNILLAQARLGYLEIYVELLSVWQKYGTGERRDMDLSKLSPVPILKPAEVSINLIVDLYSQSVESSRLCANRGYELFQSRVSAFDILIHVLLICGAQRSN